MAFFAVLVLYRVVGTNKQISSGTIVKRMFKTIGVQDWSFLDSAGFISLAAPEKDADENLTMKIMGKMQSLKLNFKLIPTTEDLSCGTNYKWSRKPVTEEITPFDQARWLDRYFVTSKDDDLFKIMIVDQAYFDTLSDVYLGMTSVYDFREGNYTNLIDYDDDGTPPVVLSIMSSTGMQKMIDNNTIPNGLYGVFNNLQIELKGDGSDTGDVSLELFVGDVITFKPNWSKLKV